MLVDERISDESIVGRPMGAPRAGTPTVLRRLQKVYRSGGYQNKTCLARAPAGSITMQRSIAAYRTANSEGARKRFMDDDRVSWGDAVTPF